MRLLLTALVLLAGCKKTQESPKAPQSDAAVPAASVTIPPPSANVPSARTTCSAEPKRGIAIPASGRATEIRIASAGNKAFVTWWEAVSDPNGGHAIDTAVGHVLEGDVLGPRLTLDANSNLDEPISGAAPVAIGSDLFAISCAYLAPQGWYRCGKTPPGGKLEPFFSFTGIGSGGPDIPGIAAVISATSAADSIIFVPNGSGAADLLMFSARVSATKKGHPFSFHESAKIAHADGLVAVASGADEATVVYRAKNAIQARHVGFDEATRGKPMTLSTPKSQVGVPAAASDGTHVVALFSERAAAADPWHVAMSDLGTTTALALGGQAQGPGIASRGACFVVTWVEGSGKGTRTRIGQLCSGAIDPRSVGTLSPDGVEGGRAYPTQDFVVWQELPAGKPAELRIAKLACP